MKKEFNLLKGLLFDSNTYSANGDCNWSEVSSLLEKLEDKIDEVEKRMECAIRSAKEINESITKYTEEIDDELPIKMSINDHDSIQNSSDDVRIALSLDDNMCVADNWYNLFSPKESEETYPIVNCLDCGHPQPLLEENIHVDSVSRYMVCEQCENQFNIDDEPNPIAVGNIEYDFPEEVYTIGNADNSEIIGDVYESIFIKLLEGKVILTENDNGFKSGKANYIISHEQFIPLIKFHQIDLSKVPIKREEFMSFESSWGTITCDKEGYVIEVIGDEEFKGERNYLYDIWQIDMAEYGKFCESKNIVMGEYNDDILSVGFWSKVEGKEHLLKYNEPDADWRKSMFTPEDDEAPTVLCQTPQTHEFVKDIIAKLKVIDVDGETMEYILRQVGMEEQMLKQLFAQSTNDEIDYLHDVRNGKG